MSLFSSQVLSLSPAVYLRLGDTSGVYIDSSGNGRDGTDVGGMTRGVAGLLCFGDTDKSVSNNGTLNKYIDIPYAPNPQNDWSLITLYQGTYAETGAGLAFVQQLDGTGTGRSMLFLGSSSNGLLLGAPACFIGNANTSTTVPINDGFMHMVVVTYKASTTTITIYVDGVQRGQGVHAAEAANGNLRLGAGKTPASNSMMRGTMDEFAFFTSTLDSSQIAQLWALAAQPSLIHIDGFEHGVNPNALGAQALAASLYDSLSDTGNLTSIVTPATNRSQYAVRCVADGTNTVTIRKEPASLTGLGMVTKVSLYISAFPNGACDIMKINSNTNSIGTATLTSTGVQAAVRGGSAGSTVTLQTGIWYTISLKCTTDASGNYTSTLSVYTDDGILVGSSTATPGAAQTGVNISSCAIGPQTVRTSYDIQFDDWTISQRQGDHPLLSSVVRRLDPDPNGSVTNAGTLSDFKDETGTSIQLASALSHLDASAPWENALFTAPPARYIVQTIGSASDILKLPMQDIITTSAYSGVEVVGMCAGNGASTISNGVRALRLDATEISTGTVNVSKSVKSTARAVVTPPGGGWTQTEINGLQVELPGQTTAGRVWESVALMVDMPLPLTSSSAGNLLTMRIG